MSSREQILAEVSRNQPSAVPLPDLSAFKGPEQDNVQEYMDTFIGIGGSVLKVDNADAVKVLVAGQFDASKRIVTTLPALADAFELYSPDVDPHTFENVELAVIGAHFAVAENGAVWLTDDIMGQRILPFICQHLAVLVDASSILPAIKAPSAPMEGAKSG